MENPKNHPTLDHVSIETSLDLEISHNLQKPSYIELVQNVGNVMSWLFYQQKFQITLW